MPATQTGKVAGGWLSVTQMVAPNGASFHLAPIPWIMLHSYQSQVKRGSFYGRFFSNQTQSIKGNQMEPFPIDKLGLFPICLIETHSPPIKKSAQRAEHKKAGLPDKS